MNLKLKQFLLALLPPIHTIIFITSILTPSLLLLDLVFWVFLLVVWLLAILICSPLTRRLIRTLPRDIKGFCRLHALQSAMDAKWHQNKPIGDHFQQIVEEHPTKACIIEADTGQEVTFHQLNEKANQFANFFKENVNILEFAQNGGDNCVSIGLFLDNCIEFIAIWLGLSRLGVVTAWLNSQLRGQSLAHSLRIAHCKAVITSRELLPAIIEAKNDGLIDESMKVYLLTIDSSTTSTSYNHSSDAICKITPNDLRDGSTPTGAKIDFRSVLAFLFTSGTTGQPKAVLIRHYRYYFMGIGGQAIYGIRPKDRIYIPLPLYHGMGGIAGVGQMVVNGCTIVIRRRFSARHFWSDSTRFECTVAFYIGEICRYLLAQPCRNAERQHKIRMLCGLGLRPRIWRQFVRRFGIKQIGELYGATEGNATCVNIDYHLGAVGFLPILTYYLHKTSIRLVKLDPETGEYLRDSNGLCVLCEPGETGEIVGMIRTENPTRRFEGYLDKAETEKKIIHDIEEIGDSAFASGDILRWDNFGYLYFKDRRGDTFRWLGENVSTTEVEGLLQDMPELSDVAVYGVEVSGHEGKAGMCAIAMESGQDEKQIIHKIGAIFANNLPHFAMPLFLRVCDRLEKTGTFKLKKAKLQKESFENVPKGERIYFWDKHTKEYRENPPLGFPVNLTIK